MSAQGYGLPTLEPNNACHSSGFGTGTVTCVATAAEICDASQCKPINDTKNDWQHQHGQILWTEG
uniref:Uncharacterized protein n=1 Tax=Romanomermis culicivorax TaxID=13658 RepID=A0A915JC82_ROMCU